MFPRFGEPARLLQSNNVGCGLLDDTETIKLQLTNNAVFPAPGAPVRMNLFIHSHYTVGSSADPQMSRLANLHAWVLSLTVDAAPSFVYKPPMFCAYPRLMATTDSRGVAVGPRGVRVR